jgi:hypothetical protein
MLLTFRTTPNTPEMLGRLPDAGQVFRMLMVIFSYRKQPEGTMSKTKRTKLSP